MRRPSKQTDRTLRAVRHLVRAARLLDGISRDVCVSEARVLLRRLEGETLTPLQAERVETRRRRIALLVGGPATAQADVAPPRSYRPTAFLDM